ncbi:MAG: cupin domain-containing protein [Acidimicrobiales bacterium]
MSVDHTTGTAHLDVNHLTDDSFGATGRRAFLKYRDLGLEGATDGRLRATMMRSEAKNEATGWHYHQCDVQFIYVVDGWVELEFEGGRTERLEKGSSMTIPGGVIHNETAMADNFELIEVCSPANMGTVAVDAPA